MQLPVVYIFSVVLLHALLIGICCADQSLFPETVTDQLHTDGQSLGIRAAGNADTGQVWVLGLPPNAVEQPQNIFVFVASST